MKDETKTIDVPFVGAKEGETVKVSLKQIADALAATPGLVLHERFEYGGGEGGSKGIVTIGASIPQAEPEPKKLEEKPTIAKTKTAGTSSLPSP